MSRMKSYAAPGLVLVLCLAAVSVAGLRAHAQSQDVPQDLNIPGFRLPDVDEGGFGDEDLEGDPHDFIEDGEDDTAPPLSAGDGNEDGFGAPLQAEVAPPPPPDRETRLRQLYERLAAASDAAAAEPVVAAIRQTWQLTGSPTIDLLLSRASQFAQEADIDLALKIVDAALDLAPDEAEAWHQRAVLHYLQQNYDDALADLRRALAREPNHFDALSSLGVVFEELGQKRAALEAYRKALKVNPFLDIAREAEEKLSREVEGQGI